MELSKCLGCMEQFRGYPCPECGFDPRKVTGTEYALPLQTILAGKYMVGRVLGQGGFGITYIGWDIALERKVAIKEYYPSGQVSRSPGTRMLTWYTSPNARNARQEGMQMFLKEARKMARLDEIPGVVKVRDLFQENETAYIIMDFVEGQTLKSLLQKGGPMSWEQAKEIFRPAIQAMEQVHQAGLIHRDLSPDNLMLTHNGAVKILDLGAAKDLNINSGASSMQVAKGGYSPLEQYTQRGGSGPWTDVYAMAATIYSTLTGTLPPNSVDRLESDALRWDLPGLQTMPAPALNALKRAMEVRSKDRIQSMAELAKGLFAQDKTQEPESAPEKKPSRWLIPAVAAVLIVLCGAGFWIIQKIQTASGPSLKQIQPHEHIWLEATCTSARVCQRCGVYDGEALGHQWSEATCTDPQTCLRCGAQSGAALEHQWKEATCTDPQTCLRCGAQSGAALEHQWKEATYDEPQTCLRCGVQTGESIREAATQASATPISYFSYKKLDNGIKITGFKEGLPSDVVIPEFIEGIPVTTIGRYAFSNCAGLTSVIIPDSVICVDDYSFRACESLTKIVIPKSVASVGENPFEGSPVTIYLPSDHPTLELIDGVLFDKIERRLIAYPITADNAFYAIPDGTLTIGINAFSWNTSLVDLAIPSSLTTIESFAFSVCTELGNVTIPNNVQYIGGGAFSLCFGITDFTIPNTVTSIGFNPFSGSPRIKVHVSSDHPTLEVVGGVLFEKESRRLIYYPVYLQAVSYEIPDGTRAIGKAAFEGYSTLKSVTIPPSVTIIEEYAFNACSSLESIEIPKSVSSIGQRAFFQCPMLKSVTINRNCTVHDEAFPDGCSVSYY